MTDWNSQYLKGETPWVKGREHPQLTHLEPGIIEGKWLVPGCGMGHDARMLVELGADRVVGLDIAPLAVEAASQLWSGNPQIVIELGDLFQFESHPQAGTFDGVWEHTCFCAIPPEMRPAYVKSVASALRPGGLLLACFYLTPWDADEDQTQGPPFQSSLAELDELFNEHFFLEKEHLPVETFAGREGKEWLRFLRKRE